MAKRVCIILIMWLSLVFPGPVWGVLHYYSGTMEAEFEMTHKFSILVEDVLTSLTLSITLPENYSLPNNTQNITDLDFSYPDSEIPSEEDVIDDYENHCKKLTWTNPPKGTLNVTMTYLVSSGSDWNKFVTSDKYPFNSAGLPDSVTKFLQPSTKVQSNNPIFINGAASLTSGLTTQWEAMTALNGWVMDNIYYYTNPTGHDAYSTWYWGVGTCSNYAHIALALVRAAGIPARLAHGYSLDEPYTLPTEGDPIETWWGKGTHAWIEVYYPSLGWVSYDPQRDFHHVDTHRVLIGRGADTTGILGKISSTSDSAQSGYPLWGQSFEVSWIDDSIDLFYIKSTDEIFKRSFSSAVTFIQKHIIIAATGSDGSISPTGQVFADTGSNHTFTILPDQGYYIADVLVDGISQGSVSSYTFYDVTADHMITAHFLIEDSDGDNLPDWWEQQIIDYSQSDGISDFEGVLPVDDFDSDNFSNLEEYQEETDPTDSGAHPPRPIPWLILLLED
ncbi:transglutaminase family protein [Thermodesulfobacteriota bacterium]